MVQSPSTLHVQGLMIRHEFWGELCPIRLNSLQGQINFLYLLAQRETSKTMVLQTTTRGVGRVQKIQNGTILEKI